MLNIESTTLLRINTPFGVTGLNPGTLLHVPIAESAVGTSLDSLPPLPQGEAYVFDLSSHTVYTVGAGLDGAHSGELIFDSPGPDGNVPLPFAAGTYSGVSEQADGSYHVEQIGGAPVTLGTVAFSSTGAPESYTLTDGEVISLAGDTTSAVITASTATTPEGILESYLTQLGASTTTATQLTRPERCNTGIRNRDQSLHQSARKSKKHLWELKIVFTTLGAATCGRLIKRLSCGSERAPKISASLRRSR